MTLDAGPRAHERVGHIYQSVFGFALREQIFLRGEFEASHGGVARVPQAREVLEVRAARLASTDENVVVQALEPGLTFDDEAFTMLVNRCCTRDKSSAL